MSDTSGEHASGPTGSVVLIGPPGAGCTTVGRALAGVECPEDAYNPVFTLDDGRLLSIEADYDGDPWHLSVDGVLDLEGPGPGDHNAWLAGNLADEP